MKRTTIDYDVQFDQDELEALYLDILRRSRGIVCTETHYETDEYLVSIEDDCIRRHDIKEFYGGAITDKDSEILLALHLIDSHISDFDEDVKSHAWVYVILKE